MHSPAPNNTSEVSPLCCRLHLFCERFLGEAGGTEGEIELPALSMRIGYGGTELRVSDRSPRFFVATERGMHAVDRNLAEERRLQCLVESFGAVEVEQVEHLIAPFDSQADYIVQPCGDVHSWCAFAVHAVAQLRGAGVTVTVADDYPYQVIDDDPPWVATVEPDRERLDWFGLQLGIIIEGERVDVLPALLELLEKHTKGLRADALLEASNSRIALKVSERRYITLPPERLRGLLRALLELYRGESLKDSQLSFVGSQANALVNLERALRHERSELVFEGVREVLQRGQLLARREGLMVAPTYFDDLRTTLRSYQREGVEWLQKLRALNACGVLADDMGLGKTLQTIAHLCVEKSQGRMDRPTIVIVPTSLCVNWRREIEKFAPQLSCLVYQGKQRHAVGKRLEHTDIVVTSYPILLRDIDVLERCEYHYCILDEAQAIKNHRSQATLAVKRLKARHRLCLSGTPVENNLDELWSLFNFLMPELLGEQRNFRTRFRYPIERAGDTLRLQALKQRVAPFVLRRMKEEVARDLPPKTEIVRPVELEGDQRDLYECIRLAVHTQVRKTIADRGLERSSLTVLDALLKLRQVCCDPRLLQLPAARDVKTSKKLETFLELTQLQLQEDRRILVFSQFERMLARLSEMLLARGVVHTTLSGKTTDRQRRVDAFQAGDVQVFLISLKAGGTGLNLTRADTVIHYDPWWNAAAQTQATDRAYRIGQTRPVFVYSLIAAGSVEEKMLELQRRKRQLATSLFEGSGTLANLDPATIDDLFAPLQ
jgi:SNF2 family DNA or RNA helicase